MSPFLIKAVEKELGMTTSAGLEVDSLPPGLKTLSNKPQLRQLLNSEYLKTSFESSEAFLYSLTFARSRWT